MAGDKILVFGATGPAGITLLRELLHRKLPALAYCRSPSKIPDDLASDPLLEVVKGDMSQREAISRAVAKSRAIVSLLGPSSTRQPKNTEFADYYRIIVPLMKDNTDSISRTLMCTIIKVVASGAYHNVLAIQDYFENMNDASIEWIVFRVGNLSGTGDLSAWLADRERGKAFAGPVGAPGFTSGINRSILARWLVDVAIANPPKWVRQMPAVSAVSKSG
ncbi:Hypothetical protein PENO1_000550 [Penicillium occitanis (nom. inval.)]|nr:Hypothetical protein PENO1_000550 [Penicillium occitanis (nom. inval.)]PCH09630.1 hypothetical protein PENOC_009780 [Penicillium occitanis (nom. inval.)]